MGDILETVNNGLCWGICAYKKHQQYTLHIEKHDDRNNCDKINSQRWARRFLYEEDIVAH